MADGWRASSGGCRPTVATSMPRPRTPGSGHCPSSPSTSFPPAMTERGGEIKGPIQAMSLTAPAEPADPGPSTGSIPDAEDEAYRRLFESHPAAMAIWDPATGRILAANEAASKQYGYPPE